MMRYQIITFFLSFLILVCNVNYVQCQEPAKIEPVSTEKVVPSLPQGTPKKGSWDEFEFGIDKIVPHFIMGKGREEIPLTVYISIRWIGISSPNVLVAALSDVDAADDEYVKDWSEYALQTIQDGQLPSEWKPRLGQESIVFYPSTSGHLPALKWDIELNLSLSNENVKYRIFHIYLFIGNSSSFNVAYDFVTVMTTPEEPLNNETPYASTITTTETTTSTQTPTTTITVITTDTILTTTQTQTKKETSLSNTSTKTMVPPTFTEKTDYNPYYIIAGAIMIAGVSVALAIYRKK